MKICIAYNSIKPQSFVCIQLNDQTLVFQTIQFCISHLFALSLNDKQFHMTHRWGPIRFYQTGSEWRWERWQRRCTSPELQNYLSLTIRLFSLMFRVHIGRVLLLCRVAVGVFWATRIFVGGEGLIPLQSVYSTAPTDRTE